MHRPVISQNFLPIRLIPWKSKKTEEAPSPENCMKLPKRVAESDFRKQIPIYRPHPASSSPKTSSSASVAPNPIGHPGPTSGIIGPLKGPNGTDIILSSHPLHLTCWHSLHVQIFVSPCLTVIGPLSHLQHRQRAGIVYLWGLIWELWAKCRWVLDWG